MKFETYASLEKDAKYFATVDVVDQLLKRDRMWYCMEIMANSIVVAYDCNDYVRFGDKFDELLDFPLEVAQTLRHRRSQNAPQNNSDAENH